MGRPAVFTFEDVVQEMKRASLGHQRRVDRLADSARRIAEHPGGSLPEKLADPAPYRVTLRLMNHPLTAH